MQAQTLNIALPRDLVKKIDEVAKKEYRNRSGLIREAIRVYIQDIQEWEELFAIGTSKARKAGVKNDQDIEKIIAQHRHHS